MAQHAKYWSCSPLADWIRGTKKISAGTSEEWDSWTTTAQMKHNLRFWIAEEGLQYLQDFVTWPIRKIYDVKYYINNRFVSRTHALTAHPRDIPRGEWRDVGSRFLPCLFNELVDFVEVEQAWHHCMWSDKAKSKFIVPWWRKSWLNWRGWRCPEAGLEYLKWASELVMNEDMGVYPTDKHYCKPTQQAIAAKEIIELYTWWTQVYQNRLDPMDASGWSEFCARMQAQHPTGSIFAILGRTKNKEQKKEEQKIIKLMSKIEAQYEKEDTEMLMRLIRIRNSLWT